MSAKRRGTSARSDLSALTQLILDVFRLNGRLIAAGDTLVAPLGLTSARWQVLGALAMLAAPQTVADIARSMGLTRQSVQRIANELIRVGLLEAAPNPRHARASLMQVTARGQAAFDAASQRQRPWAQSLARGIAVDEIETAAQVLRLLTERLQGNAPALERKKS